MSRGTGPWFRHYASAARNPKVRNLSDKAHRLWVTILCLTCENDGRAVTIDDMKFALSWRLDGTKSQLSALLDANLVVNYDDGYMPHEWAIHQYKSDTSTDRVKKHRAKRNVSCNDIETAPDTEPDTEVKVTDKSVTKKRATKLPEDWMPNQAEVDYAVAKGLSHDDIRTEVERFRNHWHGNGKTWVRWSKVWQNWVTSPYVQKTKSNGQQRDPRGVVSQLDEFMRRPSS